MLKEARPAPATTPARTSDAIPFTLQLRLNRRLIEGPANRGQRLFQNSGPRDVQLVEGPNREQPIAFEFHLADKGGRIDWQGNPCGLSLVATTLTFAPDLLPSSDTNSKGRKKRLKNKRLFGMARSPMRLDEYEVRNFSGVSRRDILSVGPHKTSVSSIAGANQGKGRQSRQFQ